MEIMVRITAVSLLVVFLCIICAGCGKKDASESGKKARPAKKSDTEKKTPVPEKAPESVPEPEEQKKESVKNESVKSESDSADGNETVDRQPGADEEKKDDEAEQIYQSVLKFKEEGEYQKAILQARDLMARLPDTPQARKVIPVYHKLRRMATVRRSCDENYKLLMEGESIRDRYAAEKIFLENPEVCGPYLTKKLPNLNGKDFNRILELLTKMQSRKGLEQMLEFLRTKSKPDFHKQLETSLLEYNRKQLVMVCKDIFGEKRGAEKLLSLMQRTRSTELLIRFAEVYAELPGVEKGQLKAHVRKAANARGDALCLQLLLIDKLLIKHWDKSITRYINHLKEADDTDEVDEVTALRRHLFQLTSDKKDSQVNDFMDTHISSTILGQPGLVYVYYEQAAKSAELKSFDALKPAKKGVTKTIGLHVRKRNDNISIHFRGVINIPGDGTYTFYTTSDDGTRLFIGETCVVNNDGGHGMKEESGSIKLKKGFHPFAVTFFQGTGGYGLEAHWQGPGIKKQKIPASVLFHLEE